MADIAIVDASSSKTLGKQIRRVFKSLGLDAKVASPGWFLRNRSGVTRIEKGYPCWIICWSHAIQGNAAFLDYAAVAAGQGFSDSWRPSLGPIVCTKSDIEVRKALGHARRVDLAPWYLGGAKARDRENAKVALRNLVVAVADSLRTPEIVNYFEALTEPDDKRMDAVSRFYQINRTVWTGDAPASLQANAVPPPQPSRGWAFWRKRNRHSGPVKMRIVHAALERCRKIVVTSEPLLGNAAAATVFDFLMSHAAANPTAVVPVATIPIEGDSDTKLAVCLDVGTAIHEQWVRMKPPPLLAFIYKEQKDPVAFQSRLGKLLREHARFSDDGYRSLEARLLDGGEKEEAVIAGFETRLPDLRETCSVFAFKRTANGSPNSVPGLRDLLFKPKSGETMEEPKWLFGVNGFERLLRMWGNRISDRADDILHFLGRAGVPKDGIYWIFGHWQPIAVAAAALFGVSYVASAPGREPQSGVTTVARPALPMAERALIPVDRTNESIGRVTRFAASSTSHRLAVMTPSTVAVLNVDNADPVCSLPEARYTAVAFSRDGRLIATGSQDGVVSVWLASNCGGVAAELAPDARVMSRVRRGARSEAFIEDVAFGNDDTVLGAGRDNLVHVFSIHEGERGDLEQIETLPLPSNPSRLIVDATGNVYVALARGGVIRWQRNEPTNSTAFLRVDERTILLRDLTAGGEVVVGQSDGAVEFVRPGKFSVFRRLKAAEPFTAMDLAPNGLWLAAASVSGEIQIFDAHTLELISSKDFVGQSAHSCIGSFGERKRCPLSALAIVEANGGQSARVFTSGEDGKLVVWEVATPTKVEVGAKAPVKAPNFWERLSQLVTPPSTQATSR